MAGAGKQPLDLNDLNPEALAKAMGKWLKVREELEVALHWPEDLVADCIKHQMPLMQCYICSGSVQIQKEINTVNKKIRGIRYLLFCCNYAEEHGIADGAALEAHFQENVQIDRAYKEELRAGELRQLSYSAMARGNKRPINAKVRAVHGSKQGQVNLKQLGPKRYNNVLDWGRKYCPEHDEYEKRLK